MSEKFSQMIEAEVDRRLETEAELRAEKERQEKEMLLLEKEQVCLSVIYILQGRLQEFEGECGDSRNHYSVWIYYFKIVSPLCRRTCFYNT